MGSVARIKAHDRKLIYLIGGPASRELRVTFQAKWTIRISLENESDANIPFLAVSNHFNIFFGFFIISYVIHC